MSRMQKQLALPCEIVKKHNDLVRGKLSVESVISGRLLGALISQINSHDTEFKEFYTLDAMAIIDNKSGKSYLDAQKAISELAKTTIEITFQNTYDEYASDVRTYYYAAPLFVGVKIEKAIITAKFNNEIKDYLLQLKDFFTQYNLMEFNLLPSIYSQRLFEYLKSWDNVPTRTEDLEKLYEILSVTDSLKTKYANFKARVLVKAYNDIHAKTSLNYEWEPVKKGNTVVAIRFIFAKNRRLELQQKKEIEDRQKTSAKKNKTFIAAVNCAKSTASCVPKQNDVCAMCKKFEMRN